MKLNLDFKPLKFFEASKYFDILIIINSKNLVININSDVLKVSKFFTIKFS